MKFDRSKPKRAFTVWELLVVVVLLVMIALLLLPMLARPNRPAHLIQCCNNLRQVGLAFRQWSLDHNGQYPMSIPATNGGTKESVLRGGVHLHFQVLSNELNTPKVLVCPADKSRRQAPNFNAGIGESNISYFVGVDASEALPNMLLTGDRYLTNGTMPSNRVCELTTNSVVGWTEETHNMIGNVGLADGNVQSWSTSKLREGLANTGVATNRLAMP